MREPEFVDPGTAPEYFADGLHHVELKGSNARFVLFVDRQKSNGDMVREPPFTCIIPVEAIGPAIALTLRTLPSGLVVPALDQLRGVVQSLLRLN